jgi:uncharacterized damage-inducible protein DinB
VNETQKLPEPWLRGTLTETPAVLRAVIHALQAAEEDLSRWCGSLTEEEIRQRPAGLASVGFHLRHIPGSIDRLLTYAEGGHLSDEQLRYLKTEVEPEVSANEAMETLSKAMKSAAERLQRFKANELEQPRYVGRKRVSTTVGGLIVHVADHTQRHVGQAITTARLLAARRTAG